MFKHINEKNIQRGIATRRKTHTAAAVIVVCCQIPSDIWQPYE